MEMRKEAFFTQYYGQEVVMHPHAWVEPKIVNSRILEFDGLISDCYLSLRSISQLVEHELMHISFLCNMPVNKVVDWKMEVLSYIDAFQNDKVVVITLNGAKAIIDYLIGQGICLDNSAVEKGWVVIREDGV